jgi:hypothetical protein
MDTNTDTEFEEIMGNMFLDEEIKFPWGKTVRNGAVELAIVTGALIVAPKLIKNGKIINVVAGAVTGIMGLACVNSLVVRINTAAAWINIGGNR